jgi:hypothetical protein
MAWRSTSSLPSSPFSVSQRGIHTTLQRRHSAGKFRSSYWLPVHDAVYPYEPASRELHQFLGNVDPLVLCQRRCSRLFLLRRRAFCKTVERIRDETFREARDETPQKQQRISAACCR